MDLDQALELATTGVATVWTAIAFVAKGTVEATKALNATTTSQTDGTYREAFSKISKSGQGILKLGMELVRDVWAASPPVPQTTATTTKFRGTHKIDEELPSISATLPVGDKVLASTAAVTYRPTISLSPAEASVVWGYTVEEEETTVTSVFPSITTHQDFSLDQLKEMATNAGQWTGNVLASAAKDIGEVLDDSRRAVDRLREDFAYQQAVNAEVLPTGPGPAYFLNVHETTSPAVSFAANIAPRPMEKSTFFFAN